MNKQELIEKIEAMPNNTGFIRPKIDKHLVLALVRQLDEPQKVVVPQFVADWYEENKDDFEFNVWDWIAFRNEPEKLENKEFNYWINDGEGNPIQTLVNMHQFGYEVEKEKRYLVKVKGMKRVNGCLAINKKLAIWFFGTSGNSNNYRTHHTRTELEEAGFDWVFDCEGIEIEKVEE